MNNFAVITKAEQDVAKAKEHLSVLKQKITDSKKKLEEAKADYESNIDSVSEDTSGLHGWTPAAGGGGRVHLKCDGSGGHPVRPAPAPHDGGRQDRRAGGAGLRRDHGGVHMHDQGIF